MSEDDAETEGAPQQGGVFGNLPGSRPGTRSPRRDRGKRVAAKPGAANPKATKQKAAPAKPKPRAAPKPPEAEPRRRPEPVPEERGGLEDIAWAGVAAAAEAATLGVKLANRALEALRGNSERS